MLRVVAVLALVALAYGQLACNQTTRCYKESETGCSTSFSADYTPFCAEGTYCNSNTCQRRPQINEGCASAACWGKDFTPSCSSGTCRWVNIYGAGEPCDTSSSNAFVNGGCLTGLTCSSTTGLCSALASGASCTGSTDAQVSCPPHTFCDSVLGTPSGNCIARRALNAQCAGNWECDETLICTNRGASSTAATCQAPFAQGLNQACSTSLDCAANTGCIGGTCRARSGTEADCTTNPSICGNFEACTCGSRRDGKNVTERAPATCEDTTDGVFASTNDYVTSGIISAYNSMQSCTKASDCHDAWALNRVGVVGGPNQCIDRCLRSAVLTAYHKQGNSYNSCTSASHILVPALLAVLLALVALFAY